MQRLKLKLCGKVSLSLFSNLIAKLKGDTTTIVAKGSAFVKVTEADSKELEVKSRIAAIDAYNKAKSDVVSFYEKEVTRVHTDVDAVKSKFDAILAKL